MNFRLSKYIHTIEDPETLKDNVIIYSTRTGTTLEIVNGVFQSLKDGEIEKVNADIIASLISAEILVPEFEDELTSVLLKNKAEIANTDSRILSYTIQPSGNCQLGCHYCGQKHTSSVMSNKILDLTYERIKKKVDDLSSTLKELQITWYGGEPLTGLSAIRNFSPKLISLSEEHALNYGAKMITNALNLKYSLFDELVLKHRITDFQITVDGTKEFHDKRRYLKNGNESFNLIINNIKTIVNSETYQKYANINLRCNVDSDNKSNIFEFIDYLEGEGILEHVSFYISPIHDWGDNKATIKGVSKEEFAELEIEVYLALLDKKSRFKPRLIPQPNSRPCMVVSKTSEVFDAFGNVSTCWEVPYTPYYDNSEYYSGNLLKDETVSTEKAIMRDWFDEIPTNESWCKTCKFLPVCGGACPKDWNEGTAACPPFKKNIEDRILLQRILLAGNN